MSNSSSLANGQSAHEVNVERSLVRSEILRLLKRQGARCALCGLPLTRLNQFPIAGPPDPA